MGLAVLPSRLKEELHLLAQCMVEGKNIREDKTIEKHADWAEAFLGKYEKVTRENAEDILKKEVGLVFERVLEDCGVYKYNEQGRKGFERFLAGVGFTSH
jgi:UDPglucose--hexose-1-phosphate uridylyltransferase